LVNPKDIRNIYFDESFDNDNITAVRIKLIVTALSMKKGQNQVMNKILRWSGIASLGAVHTAVQIGNVILEWDDSSICLPTSTRIWGNYRALCALDIATLPADQVRELYFDKLSQLIAKWNGTMKYDQLNNCQVFTEEVLEVLDMKKSMSGRIENFLRNLAVQDPKALIFTFVYKDEKYAFESHVDLDNFCHKIRPENGSENWRLLKAMDRVFWLRQFAISNEETMDKTMQKCLLEKYSSIGDTCYFRSPVNEETNMGLAKGFSDLQNDIDDELDYSPKYH